MRTGLLSLFGREKIFVQDIKEDPGLPEDVDFAPKQAIEMRIVSEISFEGPGLRS